MRDHSKAEPNGHPSSHVAIHEDHRFDDVPPEAIVRSLIDFVEPIRGLQPVEGKEATLVQREQAGDHPARSAITLKHPTNGQPLGHGFEHQDTA